MAVGCHLPTRNLQNDIQHILTKPPRLLWRHPVRIVLHTSDIYQRLSPLRNIIGILFEKLAIGHAEQQTGICIIDGVIIDIHTVGQSRATLAIDNGLLIAGDSLGSFRCFSTA